MLCLLQMYVIILNLQNLLFTLLYIRVRAHRGEMGKVKTEMGKLKGRIWKFGFPFLPLITLRVIEPAFARCATCKLTCVALA